MKKMSKRAVRRTENLSEQSASDLNTILKRAAANLQKRTGKLSPQNRWSGLIIFCLIGLGCSLGVLWRSLNDDNPFIAARPMRFPAFLSSPAHPPLTRDSVITAAQYQRIQAFQSLLTQKKAQVSQSSFYDSLLKARPHLLDSLRIIDSIFHSQ